MSVVLRLFLEKSEMRVLRSEVGAGRSLFAVLRLAVRESRRPNSTVQVGPPSFSNKRVPLIYLGHYRGEGYNHIVYILERTFMMRSKIHTNKMRFISRF